MISNHIIELLKIITPIIIALLVYQYTNDNHKKTLLNELDSKSGWRKTLFEIAGKDKITLDDVFKIRASLRFDAKEKPITIFDSKTHEIIKYCNEMQKNYDDKNDSCENETESKILDKNDREKARIYSRYLLANHWEVLQLTKKDYKKYEKLRKKEQKLNNSESWYHKEKELNNSTNELIRNISKKDTLN
ncbi:hypothetical protein K4S41_07105 [Staphylococcus epidermidis]|nr:hypothetical protein [Staphylococcus epidermidis]MCG2086814.1 hypothetical protein [Staphylococcus epidermidis]MCG2213314.1 hypothetical protein [Staphylococcus epidermidis]MCG2221992.1 hypothetical protein [Staphylococcus epidermidis]MCG2294741.1 hypothetical protein [Staphylococcus epidermidis]